MLFGKLLARSLATVAAAAIPVLLAATAAQAQTAAPAAASATAAPTTPAAAEAAFENVRNACRDDVKTLCASADKGEARRACLETHKDPLAPACTAARTAAADARQDRRDAFRAACGGDVAKLCATVEKGHGKMVECIRGNEAQLSPACKSEVAALPAGRGAK